MRTFDLSEKGAINTGSSRGIGKAIAEALASQGAYFVISSREQAACDLVASEINSRGAGKARESAERHATRQGRKIRGLSWCCGIPCVGRSSGCHRSNTDCRWRRDRHGKRHLVRGYLAGDK